MLIDGALSVPGVFAPEMLAPGDDVFGRILAELGARGVELKERVESN